MIRCAVTVFIDGFSAVNKSRRLPFDPASHIDVLREVIDHHYRARTAQHIDYTLRSGLGEHAPTVVVLDGCRHMPMLERADATATAITEFSP